MSGRTIFEGASPVSQSIDAVKALLTWKGRAVDPLPSKIEFANDGEESRLVMVLSNKKNSYYVVTAKTGSCPAKTYAPGQPCKHQRKYFGAKVEQPTTDSIRLDMSGFRPISPLPGEVVA